jgi:hypothetical protein
LKPSSKFKRIILISWLGSQAKPSILRKFGIHGSDPILQKSAIHMISTGYAIGTSVASCQFIIGIELSKYLRKAMINISGIIIPVNWDANGNITGLAIATHKEEEYFIENDKKATQLWPFLRQEVKITGILKSKRGKKIIKLKKITKKKGN